MKLHQCILNKESAHKINEGKRESKLIDAFAKEYGDLDEDDRAIWGALRAFLKKNNMENLFIKVQTQLQNEWETETDSESGQAIGKPKRYLDWKTNPVTIEKWKSNCKKSSLLRKGFVLSFDEDHDGVITCTVKDSSHLNGSPANPKPILIGEYFINASTSPFPHDAGVGWTAG